MGFDSPPTCTKPRVDLRDFWTLTWCWWWLVVVTFRLLTVHASKLDVVSSVSSTSSWRARLLCKVSSRVLESWKAQWASTLFFKFLCSLFLSMLLQSMSCQGSACAVEQWKSNDTLYSAKQLNNIRRLQPESGHPGHLNHPWCKISPSYRWYDKKMLPLSRIKRQNTMPSIILLVDVSAMMALKFQICHANPLTENLKKQSGVSLPLFCFWWDIMGPISGASSITSHPLLHPQVHLPVRWHLRSPSSRLHDLDGNQPSGPVTLLSHTPFTYIFHSL